MPLNYEAFAWKITPISSSHERVFDGRNWPIAAHSVRHGMSATGES
jgi:hypothetical protein